MDFVDDIVVYQAEYVNGNSSRQIICAGLFIKDESVRGNHNAIKEAMIKVNGILPDYKRIEYVELPESEYEKTSSKKIKRTSLPERCTGKGIIMM